MRRTLVRGWRTVWTVTSVLVVESLIIGLSSLPAIGFWNWVGDVRTWGPALMRTAVLAVSVAPAYVIFAVSLMGLTAFFCWALRWYTPEGEHSIEDLSPEVLRWVKYSAVTHVTRVLCGPFFRATPVWRWYLSAMGADIGAGVHINTAGIYDINLFTMGDHVVVGGQAQCTAHLVEGGKLKAAPVAFREGCTIGTSSIISPGVTVGKGASVGALSFVPKYMEVPDHTIYGGVPARFIKETEEVPVPAEELLYREPGQAE